jgi:hypothetical protein
MTDKEQYLIWSNKHIAWWRPGKAGYTAQLKEAGLYSRDEAIAICYDETWGWRRPDFPPPEIPVRQSDAVAALSEANARLSNP